MYKHWILIFFVLVLSACSSKSDRLNEQIQSEVPIVERKLEQLKQALQSGNVSNAVLLADYAKRLKKITPEHATLIDNLAKNGEVDGPFVQGLVERLEEVKKHPGDTANLLEQTLAETQALKDALDRQVFNDALSDTINVLADLSNGKLPRVQSVDKNVEQRINGSQNTVGSQLVGNPQYGNWKTNSSGISIWEWYGMYALFSNLTDHRYRYSSWSGNRPYSYYHDYGRSRYTKPSAMARQNQLETRTEKNFRQQGKRFNSPYAKQRSGATSMSRTSKARPSSGSFRQSSSYRNTVTSSGRRGSSRTSRGPRRGK